MKKQIHDGRGAVLGDKNKAGPGLGVQGRRGTAGNITRGPGKV